MTHIFAAERRSCFGTWLPLVLVLAVCSPAGAADSWVGKTILVKKSGIRIGHSEGEESVYTATLQSISYRVLAEKGNFIKVREGRVEDWFHKDDAVRLEDAVDFFTYRIRANPEDSVAYNDRGWAWKLRGELDIAIKDFDEVIRLNPKSVAAFANRGLIWSEKKDYERAIKDYDEAIRLDPKYALAFRNRGLAYGHKKDYDRAIEDYDEAIRLDPKNALGFNLRAWLWATCPEEKYRDGKRAVESATRACELTGWKDANSIDTLAAAYAEAGQFDKALAEQTKALEDKSLDREDRDKMEQRLKLYREKKPYRDVE